MPTYFDQFDFGSSHLKADGDYSVVNQIRATSSVKASAGFLNRIVVNRVTGTTIKIYDTTTIISSSKLVIRGTVGQVVIPGSNTALITLPYQVKFTKGLRILFTTATDLTISYR